MKMLASIFILPLLIHTQSCEMDGLLDTEKNNIEFLLKLSEYKIFQGNQSDLIPSIDYDYYEIPTELFTDYAEKQRLIKLPLGSSLTVKNDYLPDFPDGTMIVKTFYYYYDKRNIAKGKNVVETRLLIKSGTKWNYATYLWDDKQVDAILLTTGLNKTVNWIDERGTSKVIDYHIPNKRECATCHNSKGTIIPLGPKVRNLNIEVVRNGSRVNQLIHFENKNMINVINPLSYSALPNWHDTSLSLEKRARAYLDINCAHCHNKNGFASGTNLFFDYEIPLSETKIAQRKNTIDDKLSSGKMPKLGTTIIDEEGLALIKLYLEGL